MPNANYSKGVRLEREVVNYFKDVGCAAARTAGSHGKYDLYVVGTRDQVMLGWDKLELAGFRLSVTGLRRTGRTYEDILHIFEVSDAEIMALFIQCKRREL
jgi:Archaeal holliday junction resolvase (hjc)